MAVAYSPSNPGVVYDPRLRAAEHWLTAVQNDINAQVRELGINPLKRPVGDWQPIDRQIHDPRKYPHGFMAGRIKKFTGIVGHFGAT